MTKKLFLSMKLIAAVAFMVVVFVGVGSSVHAADTNLSDGITVDSKLDTGDLTLGDGECNDGAGNCTLRAAIEEANNDPDSSTIRFNLTGTADYTVNGQNGYTINPATPLPVISETVTIDGYTQPNSSANTNSIGQPFNGVVLVRIDGTGMTGLQLGLHLKADNTNVRGVSLTQLLGGIVIEDADNVVLEGSLIGITPDGQGLGNTTAGVLLIDTNNTRIGGSSLASRNVLSFNDTGGSGGGTSIATQPSGPVTANTNMVVQGNYIGTGLDGKVDLANQSKNAGGVVIQGAGDTSLIGGTQPNQSNIIVGNRGFGVAILSYTLSGLGMGIVPQKNAIIGNKIYDNIPRDLSPGGPNLNGLGIDLAQLDDSSNPPDGPDSFTNIGVTLNDTGDVDTGPNNYINFPVLNSVTQKDGKATVNFSLDAADSPTNQYRVELFANDTGDETGYGEGQTFLGAFTVSNGNNQQSTVTLPAGLSIVGKSISATTTAVDASTQSGFGATSEFAKFVTATNSAENNLASTGQNVGLLTMMSFSAICIMGSVVLQRRLSKN